MAPSKLPAQDVAYRETTHRGSAIAEAQRSSESSCSSRSVVQRFPSKSWRQALRELTVCRTAGRPGCRLSWKVSPNAKFAEKSVASAVVAPATPLWSGGATEDAGLVIKPAQLPPHCLQAAPPCFCPMLHETSICGRRVSVGNWATLRTVWVLPGHLFRAGRSSGIPHCWRWRAGRAAGAALESEIRRF